MPNRLANESSPYLLQHANNPVDWFPWGHEAIEKSMKEDKPIFLSIGYSACHWCHVMEHESFEDKEIAETLNAHFVSIKVDREERPDLDQIYMTSVQIMTGRGGWPMSVFLTPELQPFFGGTYWPPRTRGQMPGFDRVLASVLDAWQNRRSQAKQQATELTNRILAMGEAQTGQAEDDLAYDLIRSAGAKLEQSFDFTHGGFGQAPKFPHAIDLQVLLRIWSSERTDGVLRMVRLTLDKMASGGIYDHLGGGFARYSVDERWLVPHFEKMLYDNALLTNAFVDAYLATGEIAYAKVVRETLDYVVNDLSDRQGGFHSTEDADSEGEEGKFYVWTAEQIDSVIKDPIQSEQFKYVYGVSDAGNFEGKNILYLPRTLQQSAQIKGWNLEDLTDGLSASKSALMDARNRRMRPGKDDKILTSWNGLMIDAMARASRALNEVRYAQAAQRAAQFMRQAMVDENGRLLHTYRNGNARILAYLDDYACLANALVSLYESTFEESWIDWAVELVDAMLIRFSGDVGALYFTSVEHEDLIVRTKDVVDSSVPSGNGIAATVLMRLARLCGRNDYAQYAERIIRSSLNIIKASPNAAGQTLIALDVFLAPAKEIVLVGGENDQENKELLNLVHQTYLPNVTIAYRDSTTTSTSIHLEGLWKGRDAVEGQPTCFVCENHVCGAPLVGSESIRDRIREMIAA